jgi:FkbM family methyltransferase
VSVKPWKHSSAAPLLRWLGYQLKPIEASPRGLAGALARAVDMGLAPRTVFDVGVGRGTPWLYEAFPRAKHVLFEPLTTFRSEVDAIANELGADIHQVALSNRSGMAKIRRNLSHPTSSSLYAIDPMFELYARRVQTVHEFVEEPVQLATLDALNRYEPPYVLKLDVEGAERDVLEGARQTLSSTELIMIELSVMRRLRDELSFAGMVQLLDSAGFAFFDVAELSCAADGTLLYLDALFVPRNSGLWPR